MCRHLMKYLHHSCLSPIYLHLNSIYVSPKRFDDEEKNPFFDDVRTCRHRCFCTRPGACGHQRGDEPHDLVFRPRHQVVLRHRRRARSGGRHQDLRQVQQRRPGHVEDGGLVVLRLYLPDCSRNHSPFLLPLRRWSIRLTKVRERGWSSRG